MSKKNEISIPIIRQGKDLCRLVFRGDGSGKYDIKINFRENPFEVWTYRLFNETPIVWNVDHPQRVEASYHKGQDGWPITIHLKDTAKHGAEAYKTLPPTRIVPPNTNSMFPIPLFKLELPDSLLAKAKPFKIKPHHYPLEVSAANVLEFYMASDSFNSSYYTSSKYCKILCPQFFLSIDYFATYTPVSDYEKYKNFMPSSHEPEERMRIFKSLPGMKLIVMMYNAPELNRHWDRIHLTFIENELAEDILLCTRLMYPEDVTQNDETNTVYANNYTLDPSADSMPDSLVLPQSTVARALESNEFSSEERAELEKRAGIARVRLFREITQTQER